MNRKQSGFTLIEIMIVVALLGILAVIAIPSFSSSMRKVRAESEVTPFLAEIGNKQESYNTTRGVYFSSADWFPVPVATVNGTKRPMTVPATWATLKVVPPDAQGACTYLVQSGTGGPAVASADLTACGLTYTPPPVNWYYVLGVCDMDRDTITSCYMISSDDSTLRKSRAGE
jgi:prepilin-type N-terminal cleavage/methylation domain-containing protein